MGDFYCPSMRTLGKNSAESLALDWMMKLRYDHALS